MDQLAGCLFIMTAFAGVFGTMFVGFLIVDHYRK